MAAQRRELDLQIANLEARAGFADEDPEALADLIVARLTEHSRNLDGICGGTKRDLVEAYVERIEVDMATKDADVSLRLPAWATQGQFGMRLAPSSRSQTGADTPPRLVVRLAVADCRYVRRAREVCYDCRRRKAA